MREISISERFYAPEPSSLSRLNLTLCLQSSILARFQNYSKLEETSEEQPACGAMVGVGQGKKVNDLLGSLAEDPGWLSVRTG